MIDINDLVGQILDDPLLKAISNPLKGVLISAALHSSSMNYLTPLEGDHRNKALRAEKDRIQQAINHIENANSELAKAFVQINKAQVIGMSWDAQPAIENSEELLLKITNGITTWLTDSKTILSDKPTGDFDGLIKTILEELAPSLTKDKQEQKKIAKAIVTYVTEAYGRDLTDSAIRQMIYRCSDKLG